MYSGPNRAATDEPRLPEKVRNIMNKRQDHIDKLNKLFALASDSRSPKGERETAERMIATLMVKYQIEFTDISETRTYADDITKHDYIVVGAKNLTKPISWMAMQIAEIYGGASFWTFDHQHTAYIGGSCKDMGKRGNVVIYCTEDQWHNIKLWTDHFRIHMQSDMVSDRPKNRKAYGIAWYQHACRKLSIQMGNAYRDEGVSDHRATTAICRQTADQVMREQHKLSAGTKERIASDANSFNAGREAGKNAQMLNRSVSGRTRAALNA